MIQSESGESIQPTQIAHHTIPSVYVKIELNIFSLKRSNLQDIQLQIIFDLHRNQAIL